MGSDRVSVRSLAAECGIPSADVVRILNEAGFPVTRGGDRLSPERTPAAREALGLRRRPLPTGPLAPFLTQDQLIVRMLRPLSAKGKRGRTHTTSIENVHGRGVPDHQKGEALHLVEALIREGVLGKKISQGRTHVWITRKGLARLAEAETESSDGSC